MTLSVKTIECDLAGADWNRFLDVINVIDKSKDRNAANYHGFFHNYDSSQGPVDIVEDDGEIIAFSNLWGQGIRYPLGYSRALNRFWLHPDYRLKTMAGYRSMSVGTALMLPEQIARAKEQNLEAIFISMEFPRRRAQLKKVTDYVGDMNFHMLEHMYNTCNGHDTDGKTCWQNVSVKWFGASRRLPLPRMEIDEWHRRFS